jgi:branched-chain amino acid transport system substrate-binding protein
MITQAQQHPYNFKAFFGTVLIAFPDPMLQIFGGQAGVNGLMGGGAWNSKSSAAAKTFEEKYIARYGVRPEYWGALPAYATVQVIQQALEQVGLDQAKMRDLIASSTFDTGMGGVYFAGGFNQTFAGQIGQWQDGVFEVIDDDANRTKAPIYPKADWPASLIVP